MSDRKWQPEEVNKPTNYNLCPECGGVLIKRGGCRQCMRCGWEACE